MNYWLTTHWPPREDEPAENIPDIWLPEGREAPGADISQGDLVLIYESKTGRAVLSQKPDGSKTWIRRQRGKQGIVCIGRVLTSLVADPNTTTEIYANGTKIWWRWRAAVEVVSRSGFVPRQELALILGYDPAYSFRGFGEQRSGVRRLTEEKFHTIVERFNQSQPINLSERPISPRTWERWHSGEESDIHRQLKEFVAADPSAALNQPGLFTLYVEYSFASGDRADIVLADQYNRIIAVEIEPEVSSSAEVGALQAIKYRAMLECCADRAQGDSRALLIAHKIHANIRERCAKYGVECYEIPRERIKGKTASHTSSLPTP